MKAIKRKARIVRVLLIPLNFNFESVTIKVNIRDVQKYVDFIHKVIKAEWPDDIAEIKYNVVFPNIKR